MTTKGKPHPAQRPSAGRPSALIDTRLIYCGDCLDQLRRLPDACTDLIYIDPPFNSNRNYEVFRGDLSEPRPSGSRFQRAFDDRHASTAAYIDYTHPRCVDIHHTPKPTELVALRKARPTQYHALRNNACVASVDSKAANCKEPV